MIFPESMKMFHSTTVSFDTHAKRTMKTLTLLIASAVLGHAAFAAEAPRVLTVGTKPESVCRGFQGKLYVTMINGEEPGDGGINVVDGDKVDVFCRGMNSPKGIAFVGGFLVVADETTMWKVNSAGKVEKLADAGSFPHAIEFLNDVAAATDGKGVYVAEMGSPKWMFDPDGERQLWPLDSDKAKSPEQGCVYHVGLDGKVSLTVPPGGNLTGPNGVAVMGKEILMGDFFTGRLLAWDGKQKKILATGMRGADGIGVADDAIYVSSWPLGKVWRVDRKTHETKLLSENFTTAADLFYDSEQRQLIIPDMLEGTLTFLSVD